MAVDNYDDDCPFWLDLFFTIFFLGFIPGCLGVLFVHLYKAIDTTGWSFLHYFWS